jgi:RNA polymerase sigma-70 factor (ECF subfamily)
MTLDDYRFWLRLARKHARVRGEAEDLLQDALLVAIEDGRLDLDVEANRAWLAGVIRNRGTLDARSASRRKARERRFGDAQRPTASWNGPEPERQVETRAPGAVDVMLSTMPRAARQVAVLVLHGLSRAETRTALALSDTALRQRLTSIRRALKPLPPALKRDALAVAYARRRDRAAPYPMGLVRRALLRHLRAQDHHRAEQSESPVRRGIGTHDPTGHLLVIHSQEKPDGARAHISTREM